MRNGGICTAGNLKGGGGEGNFRFFNFIPITLNLFFPLCSVEMNLPKDEEDHI